MDKQNPKPELCEECSRRQRRWMETRIRDLAAQITTGRELCDSWLQNSESELMICQTLSAAVINLDNEKRREPYSIRDARVFSSGQCINNGQAYRRLVREGYFREETRCIDEVPRAVIFMTDKLLEAVEKHFAERKAE